MVPADSIGIPRGPIYSGTPRETVHCRIRDCHPLWCNFPKASANWQFCNSHERGHTTPQRKPPRFGLLRFRSPLLTQSIFLSFPVGTEMFHFPTLADRRYLFTTA